MLERLEADRKARHQTGQHQCCTLIIFSRHPEDSRQRFGLAAVPYAHRVVVVLRTDLAAARRLIPRSVGTLTEVPDGVRLTARAERLDGAAQMLAGLGCAFTVEEPPELRDEVRALAQRLLSCIDTSAHPA